MLLLLLVVPVITGLCFFLFASKKINIYEFLAQEVAVVLVIVIAYFVGLHGQMADHKVHSSVVSTKTNETQHCCHAYPCNCREVCSGSGENHSCSTICDTCYMHSHDEVYRATSALGETVYKNGCRSPGSGPPKRWTDIVIGETTAVEHPYENILKASPDTLFRRSGSTEKFADKIPAYPEVYDEYRITRWLNAGVIEPKSKEWDDLLDQFNSEQFRLNGINAIVLVTNQTDRAYAEGVRESWIGGKKNDLVVIIGASAYPKIDWVDVVSWSKMEELKISVRDSVLSLGSVDGEKIIGVMKDNAKMFRERSMEDFDYLKYNLMLPTWAMVLLFLIGTALSVGLSIYFYYNDPFGKDEEAY